MAKKSVRADKATAIGTITDGTNAIHVRIFCQENRSHIVGIEIWKPAQASGKMGRRKSGIYLASRDVPELIRSLQAAFKDINVGEDHRVLA
jgi:hypothetical protein